jgi:hypothetical protein
MKEVRNYWIMVCLESNYNPGCFGIRAQCRLYFVRRAWSMCTFLSGVKDKYWKMYDGEPSSGRSSRVVPGGLTSLYPLNRYYPPPCNCIPSTGMPVEGIQLEEAHIFCFCLICLQTLLFPLSAAIAPTFLIFFLFSLFQVDREERTTWKWPTFFCRCLKGTVAWDGF